MPYVFTFATQPVIQVTVQDPIFDVPYAQDEAAGDTSAIELNNKDIRDRLHRMPILVGEHMGGGRCIIYADKVAFIQYITQLEFERQEANRKADEERRRLAMEKAQLGRGSTVTPVTLIPGGRKPTN